MSNKITFSKVTFFLCFSFITGVFFAPISIFLGFFLIFGFYLILRNPLLSILCFVFFLAGVVNFYFTLYNTPEVVNTPILGRLIDIPDVVGNFTRFKIETKDGRALLYTDKYEEYKYGDVIVVSGNFQVPENEDYKNYLKKDKVYYTSFYPEIKKIGEQKNLFYEKMYSLRARMKKNIQRSLPSPQNFLAEAMILGDRSSFSKEFNEKLSISGTRHITAISGMHIVIISTILFLLFSSLRIKKKWSAVLSLLFIILFIVFVGAPSSAVRAGIMGSVVLLTYITHRKTQSLRIIFFTGAAMLVFNPLLLHYDLGFQLSFLAVIGILTFCPLIKKKITKEKNNNLKNQNFVIYFREKVKLFFKKNERLAELVAVTISAQILVTPLILYKFGHISVFSLPANILIVPLLQYIMPFIFLTAITGFFVFSFITHLLLSFVILVINFFAQLPFSAIYIEVVPVYIIIFLYFFIIYKSRKLIYI